MEGAAIFLYNPCGNIDEINRFKKIAKSCLRKHVITPNKNLPTTELFNIVTYGCRLRFNKVENNMHEIIDYIKVRNCDLSF